MTLNLVVCVCVCVQVASAALIALLSLAAQVSCKNACSKDWLRYMVVNACGMDKRHLDRKKPAFAPPVSLHSVI